MADIMIRKRKRMREKEVKALGGELSTMFGVPVFTEKDVVDMAESSDFDLIFVNNDILGLVYEGKPFLTVRTSLWHPDGYDGVTKEWMQEQADIINSYAADNNSINGYSAICVHAWSVTPENLDYLVSLLDSHIEIVNVNQLVKMITENVPHKNAKPN